jgi:hypothetical protein
MSLKDPEGLETSALAVLACLIALALAGPAAAALPQAGVLVPGRSLGGIRLGAPEQHVKALWGPRFGVCRDCSSRTLYFTYVPFAPQGAGAVFRRGSAVALYTLWSPTGWRATRGIRVGDPVALVRRAYPRAARAQCDRYSALTLVRERTITAFYVLEGKVWGFGLSRAGARLCP